MVSRSHGRRAATPAHPGTSAAGAGPILERSSGILLHLSSLPGAHGHGDLGNEARKFVDFLVQAKQRYWQVLPIHPPGAGDSPYGGMSAFAGHALLISIDHLVDDGLLEQTEVRGPLPKGRVDFARARARRLPLLQRAHQRFVRRQPRYRRELNDFRERAEYWLADYSLFMALRDAYAGKSWLAWDEGVRARRRSALEHARAQLAKRISYYEFEQFIFDRQWRSLKAYAAAREVKLIGDIPIFVALDSADVWANQRYFQLTKEGRPTHVSGVPPDYFSRDGQLWGTPLYDWRTLKKHQYRFWSERCHTLSERFDLVRLDHFIGFVRYWQVPGAAQTAKEGVWQAGPGRALFTALERKLGGLPFIAEDLGEMDGAVEALRDELALPGMRVLQFGFGSDAHHPFLPHNYVQRSVAYTGTHDNSTLLGWLERGASDPELRYVRRYVGDFSGEVSLSELIDQLIRSLYASVAALVIVPLQDVLKQGDDARMNVPGQATGNWSYRVDGRALNARLAKHLATLVQTYGR